MKANQRLYLFATILLAALSVIFVSCDDQEENIAVTGIKFDEEMLTLLAGNTETLSYTIEPGNATNLVVTWESDRESVATVDNGVITGVGEGRATITATTEDGGFKASCAVEVTIEEVRVKSVALNKDTLDVAVDYAGTLTASITPSNATNKKVSWATRDTLIATVSSKGVVTGVKQGETFIVVTTRDRKRTDSCLVRVFPKVPVTGITLSTTDTTLLKQQTFTLVPTVAPGNATDKSVTWKSSSNAIARVSNNGLVTAVAEGAATITVTTTDGELTETCVVNVVGSIPVTGVTLDITDTTLTAGGTFTLVPTVTPGNATDKSVTWESSNTATVTVDNDGLVTAIAEGAATITVTTTDGELTATCVVNVVASTVPVTGVTFDEPSIRLAVDATVTLAPTIAPDNATDKSVTWESNDTAIATVDNDGLVTAVATGSTTITVTTTDGGHTATITVEVE